MKPNQSEKNIYGDFQTPPELAQRVCEYLAKQGVMPQILIEPTCGIGNFIHAALQTFPPLRTIYATELNPLYCQNLQSRYNAASDCMLYLHNTDALRTDFSAYQISDEHTTLILGNPPWATNAALGGNNLPDKVNIKNLRGLDAMTGKSNFDIAEYLMIKLLRECAGSNVIVAVILKNSVIRNLLQAAPTLNLPISQAQMVEIDTKQYFGVDVAASLFFCRAERTHTPLQCKVVRFDDKCDTRVQSHSQPHNTKSHNTKTFGWYVNSTNRFVADVDKYSLVSHLEGTSIFEWRQGIKHDAASVMELTKNAQGWINKQESHVEVEEDSVFPLVKSTQLANSSGIISQTNRAVIVPQRSIGEDTSELAKAQPRLYAYLQAHQEIFAARKSSIYRNKPPFSIFGIGDYSFKPYKIAISGLHKKPVFVLLSPICGKPVMLDDTSYFLGFDTASEARKIHHALQSPEAMEFFAATVFLDAKRPFTKEVLMRLDIERLVKAACRVS